MSSDTRKTNKYLDAIRKIQVQMKSIIDTLHKQLKLGIHRLQRSSTILTEVLNSEANPIDLLKFSNKISSSKTQP